MPEVDGVDATELAELLASLRGDGDGVRFDLLAPIARLARVRALLDAAEGELVVGAKLGGYTWREIAMQADVSASTLLRRHGKRWRTARALRSAALDAGLDGWRGGRPRAALLQSPPMDGHSLISTDILASYAADAAREVPGVRGLVESHLHRHRGVRVSEEDGSVAVELHLAVAWETNVPEIGATVQRRVADYLQRMADVTPERVDVVVDEIGRPPLAGA